MVWNRVWLTDKWLYQQPSNWRIYPCYQMRPFSLDTDSLLCKWRSDNSAQSATENRISTLPFRHHVLTKTQVYLRLFVCSLCISTTASSRLTINNLLGCHQWAECDNYGRYTDQHLVFACLYLIFIIFQLMWVQDVIMHKK